MKTPTAFIAVNHNRVKIYNEKDLFFQNNQEFEFELFNPLQERIVAKVRVNGINIGDDNDTGIILQPGQRIYLERYLSKPAKFKFETYNVENGNADVEQAIVRNGDIEISFHKIKEQPLIRTPFKMTLDSSHRKYSKGASSGFGCVDYAPESLSRGICDNLELLCDSVRSATSIPAEKETGRIQEGSYSSQSFKTIDLQFDKYPFHTIEYKIYPESQKNLVIPNDVAIYCTECGRRKKKANHKFCPGCGHKF